MTKGASGNGAIAPGNSRKEHRGQQPSKGECRDCIELEICILLRSSGHSLPRSDGTEARMEWEVRK